MAWSTSLDPSPYLDMTKPGSAEDRFFFCLFVSFCFEEEKKKTGSWGLVKEGRRSKGGKARLAAGKRKEGRVAAVADSLSWEHVEVFSLF